MNVCFLVPTCVHPPKERLLVLSRITLHLFNVQRSISGLMGVSFVALSSNWEDEELRGD